MPVTNCLNCGSAFNYNCFEEMVYVEKCECELLCVFFYFYQLKYYIYIYIYRERERERERDRESENNVKEVSDSAEPHG